LAESRFLQETEKKSGALSFNPPHKRSPPYYPPIELNLKNSSFQDHEESYWAIEQENLRRQFADLVKPKMAAGKVAHFSRGKPPPLCLGEGQAPCRQNQRRGRKALPHQGEINSHKVAAFSI
jgi:hypothetical protein